MKYLDDNLELKDEFRFMARIAVTGARPVGDDISKFMIGGAFLCPSDVEPITTSGQWEGIACEVIIRPLKTMGELNIKNARLDHAVLALSDDDAWEIKNETT